jgi:hypothetical protein
LVFRATYSVLVVLLIANVAPAQDRALEAIISESARLRRGPLPSESDYWKDNSDVQNRLAALHGAIRDWIESLLPKTQSPKDAELPLLNARLQAELQSSKLIHSNSAFNDFRPGLLTRVDVSHPSDDADKLTVIVGVEIPCGADEVAYLYDYSQGRLLRVLESHGTRGHDESIYNVHLSKPDAFGNQLFLTSRTAVQCGSSWNELSYDLFRLSGVSAVPILSGQHEIWFGTAHPYQVRLDPGDLLMEIRAHSIDDGIHNRAHVLHFKIDGSTVERIDPVALQPQDFVDEWITRPWSEMESRSAAEGNGKMQKWHGFIADEFVFGEFRFVQACQEKAGQWQIGVDMHVIKGKELPEDLSLYFLVQQSDGYRFKMAGISFQRQEGCPGESQPSIEGPTLFSSDHLHDQK